MAGSNYPGWLTAVVRLVYRTCFLGEELFFGINKGKASSKTDKISLEENIRCYNPMAVGGDLRATVDRQLQANTKFSAMATRLEPQYLRAVRGAQSLQIVAARR